MALNVERRKYRMDKWDVILFISGVLLGISYDGLFRYLSELKKEGDQDGKH